ncbi:MAG: MarR family winged helix-turn-helix transcriptional regulator [bacterium]|nr:MarR family winged helix-turn-helix transcriptional regulator [bacterium]
MASQYFDPEIQVGSVDGKIVAGLERIAQVFRVLLWREAGEFGLSPIQLQILLFLRHHPAPALRTVSHLAREFNMTKATVSDAVKILLKKELLVKAPGASDARSFRLDLSAEGKRVARKLKGFGSELAAALEGVDESEKQIFTAVLLRLVFRLHETGIIQTQRMCYSCAHFQSLKAGGAYCRLLEQKLRRQDLRLDCPEHAVASV